MIKSIWILCAMALAAATLACSSGSSGGGSDGGSASTDAVTICVNGTGTALYCSIFPAQSMCYAGTTPASSCPTAGAGCCKGSGGDETCYYDPALSAMRMSACTQLGGTWSTTP